MEAGVQSHQGRLRKKKATVRVPATRLNGSPLFVSQMHSGTFTHHIAPVLSPPQVLSVFSLLGYRASSSEPEQLCLDPPRVSLDDLLRLACAFFVARCECRLLLAALGKHSGNAQWELSVVRERQRGSSLQVCVRLCSVCMFCLCDSVCVCDFLFSLTP